LTLFIIAAVLFILFSNIIIIALYIIYLLRRSFFHILHIIILNIYSFIII
jgi:hypothetical protein